jgi:transposase
VSQQKPYPSDLSDARWALIEPALSGWRKARLDRRPTGRPASVELRDVCNAILYVNRTGIPWKYLPHDFPNHGTVYAYYAARRDEGIFAQLNYDLTGLARVKEGRKPEPTASVIDAQSVETSTNVSLTSQGTDAAKKINTSGSMSRSSTETPTFADSASSKGAGSWNEVSAGSCCADASRVITRASPPAQKP